MKICVCIKQVPDSWSEKHLFPETHLLDRSNADLIINEADDYAIEEALRQVEAHGGDVTVVTMGPARATESLRKALALGVTHAVHISDPAMAGSDALATSRVLATYLAMHEFNLVLFGATSSDAGMGVVPSMVATRLGWPALTLALTLTIEGTSVEVRRMVGSGYDELSSTLPAVVSVGDKINTPRYPNFKGILAAKKAEILTVDLNALGLEASEVGAAGSVSHVIDVALRPEKQPGRVITDEGTAAQEIFDYLTMAKLLP